MKPASRYFTLLLMLIITGTCFHATAQSELRKKHYLYDLNSEVLVDHTFATGRKEASLYLKLTLNNENSIGEYVLRYVYYQKISEAAQIETSSKSDTIRIREDMIGLDKNVYYFKVSFPITTPVSKVIVKVANIITGNEYQYHFPYSTNKTFTPGDLVIMEPDRDIPIFDRFISEADSFRLVSVYNTSLNAYFYHYNDVFQPARPPFILSPEDSPENLKIDSTFRWVAGETGRITEEGLYFVQSDTSGLSGVSFNIVSKYFPKTAKIEELIDQIIYISTSKEYRLLQDANTKSGFDSYWLQITKSQDKAKRIISNYYTRIREANMLFSDYKPGWKTDRGMIYIIYGAPNQIERENDREVWVYQKTRNMSKIRFNFVRIRNLFSNDHFELVRDEDYSQIWFRSIDLWRRGIPIN